MMENLRSRSRKTMKKLLFFLLYLITICGGAYLGICVFDSPLAIYLTGVFVGDFSLLFINIMKDI